MTFPLRVRAAAGDMEAKSVIDTLHLVGSKRVWFEPDFGRLRTDPVFHITHNPLDIPDGFGYLNFRLKDTPWEHLDVNVTFASHDVVYIREWEDEI